MKVFTIFFLLFLATSSYANDSCYQNAADACNRTLDNPLYRITNCNAKYGAIDNLQYDLQHYANHFLYRSFNFLIMSTYFGNYIKNRPGFEKLYRTLSDSSWNDGIELIKYIDSRGGSMAFTNIAEEALNGEVQPRVVHNWELNELQSLAVALDLEKSLATEAFKIHFDAEAKEKWYDPEIAYYIDKTFLNKEKDVVRKLAGYTHDLGELLSTKDSSLALYLFDEILQEEKY